MIGSRIGEPPLSRTGKPLIFDSRPVAPEGPHNPCLYLVGEAPGKTEAQAGRPFVGRAGEALREMMREAGMNVSRVRLANAISLRPVERTAGERVRNRQPTSEELQVHGRSVLEDIARTQPELVVALGRSAALLFGIGHPIGEARGREYRFDDVALRVTYHPSYVLRFGGRGSELWRCMVEDLARFWAEAQRR